MQFHTGFACLAACCRGIMLNFRELQNRQNEMPERRRSSRVETDSRLLAVVVVVDLTVCTNSSTMEALFAMPCRLGCVVVVEHAGWWQSENW